MKQGWLDVAMRTSGLRLGSRFPRDLMGEIVMQLPVSIEVMPSLSAHAVWQWHGHRGIQHVVSGTDRALHGCLVARAGMGVVFLDAGDEEAERRFTFAHEIAHFVLDHLVPRRRALKVFGKHILPVLDGMRPPTREEKLSAVLERVPLGVQVHLMNRGSGGAICAWDVEESEQRADRFALELLAPEHTARTHLRRIITNAEGPACREKHTAGCLAEQFGMPADVASSYVHLLLRGQRRPLSLSEEVFRRR